MKKVKVLAMALVVSLGLVFCAPVESVAGFTIVYDTENNVGVVYETPDEYGNETIWLFPSLKSAILHDVEGCEVYTKEELRKFNKLTRNLRTPIARIQGKKTTK